MRSYYFRIPFSVITIFILAGTAAWAHCDTMDGPVVKAAQRALETKDVNLVLVWVQPEDESEIKDAFKKTLKIRQLSPEAKEFADRYFFETLVRIHRAGEGEPYTGIKPSGYEIEPGIQIADEAVDSGSPESLVRHISDTMKERIITSFNEVKESMNYQKDNINAGREYVKAYVEFIHYIGAIHSAVTGSGEENLHPSDIHKH